MITKQEGGQVPPIPDDRASRLEKFSISSTFWTILVSLWDGIWTESTSRHSNSNKRSRSSKISLDYPTHTERTLHPSLSLMN